MGPIFGHQHGLHLACQFKFAPQGLLLQCLQGQRSVSQSNHQNVRQGDEEIQVLDNGTHPSHVLRRVAGEHHSDGRIVLMDGHDHVVGMLIRPQRTSQAYAVQVQGFEKLRGLTVGPIPLGAFGHHQPPRGTVELGRVKHQAIDAQVCLQRVYIPRHQGLLRRLGIDGLGHLQQRLELEIPQIKLFPQLALSGVGHGVFRLG